MKRSVKTEYFNRVRSAVKSKLNAGTVFQAINIWAVPKVRYDTMDDMIQWIKEKLQQIDTMWYNG